MRITALSFILIIALCSCSKAPRERFLSICTHDKSTNAEELKQCPCLAEQLEAKLAPDKFEEMVSIMEKRKDNAELDPAITSNKDMMAGLFRASLACSD